MREVTAGELELFVEKWLKGVASDDVVIDWARWEGLAADFFDVQPQSREIMHGVMSAACVICNGAFDDIKDVMRALTPSELEYGSLLLGHLPQVKPLFEAERHFRADNLIGDWTLAHDDNRGAVVVRSNFRASVEIKH